MDEHDTKLLIDAQLREKYGDASKENLKITLLVSVALNIILGAAAISINQSLTLCKGFYFGG